MALDSKQAYRLFFATGLPQAYSYGRAAQRRERRQAHPPRRQED